MASLKELRGRIKSTNSTKRITSAMKMVAAAKLRRAEEEVSRARPYFHRMMHILSGFDGTAGTDSPILSGKPNTPKTLLVLITTDKGLCGPLNSNIFKRTLAEIKREQEKQYDYITIGSKGTEYVRRNAKDSLLAYENNLNSPSPSYKNACKVSDLILSSLETGNYGQCIMYYSSFVSAIEQKVEEMSLMPFGKNIRANETSSASQASTKFIEYEPDAESVLAVLVKRALETAVYTALLEAFASEQGARMTAMDSANRNAGEMIDKLTITYNRSRQANITNELIEVISGAAAV